MSDEQKRADGIRLTQLNRRTFLKGMAASAGAALLAACGGAATATAPAPTKSSASTPAAAGAATTSSASSSAAATSSAASSAVSTGAAAGSSSAAGGAPTVVKSANAVTINWFASRDSTGYAAKQADAFNAQNANIQINYQEQGATTTDLHDKFVTVATAKDSSVDLISMDVPFVPEFAAAGWTISTDDILSADEKAKFFKGTLDGATYNGKLYAIPWYNNGPGLFYRKDLLDAAGLQPPKTYDDLLAQSKKLATGDMSGFIFQASQTEGGIIIWLEYLWGYGGELVDDKFNVVVDKNSLGVDALKKLVDFLYTDKISPEACLTMKTTRDATTPFTDGKAVFLRNWMTETSAMDADTSKVKGKWDVTTLPSKDGSKPGPGCLGTWNLGISAFSKHQKEAAEAIKFLTSLDQQTKNYLNVGKLPARTAVFDDPAVTQKYPFAAKLRPSFENLKPRPVTPYYSQMSADALQPNYGAATSRSKTPDQAVKDMADKMRQVLKG
ncbi:MAG: ABC transporter substrate-binding protein [Thermomicrobiales bacterium]